MASEQFKELMFDTSLIEAIQDFVLKVEPLHDCTDEPTIHSYRDDGVI